MGDEKKVVGLDISVPESVDHAIENLSGPLTKSVGDTLGDLWFLALGGLSHRANLRRAKYAQELQLFKENTEKKIEEILPEKRTEPNTQIIMSALTDAQFCVECEDLRKMFENLIASSIDTDKANDVHPSFPSIIRRMSPLDAKTLQLFKEKSSHPLARLGYVMKSGGLKIIFSSVFLGNLQTGGTLDDIARHAQSIDCLVMLGLLRPEYDRPIMRPNAYDNFGWALECLKEPLKVSDTYPWAKEVDKVQLIKGRVELTEFGNGFIKVCI
jgi:hypothetical protein